MSKTQEVYDLFERYQEVVNAYCRAFCHSENIEPDYYWVGGEVGGILELCDHFIDFRDLKYAVDNETYEGSLFKWSDYVVELETLGCAKTISYKDFCNGNRPYTEQDLDKIRAARAEVELARDYLENLLKDIEK